MIGFEDFFMSESEVESGKKFDAKKAATTTGGSIGLIAVIYLLNNLSTTVDEFSKELPPIKESLIKITAELDIVSPRDIQQDVSKLPTKQDVSDIVRLDAPWTKERNEWMSWRNKKDTAIQEILKRLRELERK